MGTPRRTGRDRVGSLAVLSKLLGSEVRLEVLRWVAVTPSCVCQLASRLALGTSLVSHHLRELEAAGLVEHTREGRRHRFRVRAGVEVSTIDDMVVVSLPAGVSRMVLVMPRPGAPEPAGVEVKPHGVDRILRAGPPGG